MTLSSSDIFKILNFHLPYKLFAYLAIIYNECNVLCQENLKTEKNISTFVSK